MSMPKLSFSVSMTQLRAAGAVGRVDPVLAREPGTSTIRSRGNDTTNVLCAPGSTCATISVSELLPAVLSACRTRPASSGLSTNCRVSLPMMR